MQTSLAAEAQQAQRGWHPGVRVGGELLAHVVLPIGLLVAWQVAADHGLISPSSFPAPLSMARMLWSDALSGKLETDLLASLQRVVWGLVIGSALGIVTGLAMAMSQTIDRLLTISVQVLRAIPPITWIGFSILWFGLGDRPAIFLIALGVVFPMLLNTYAGVRQVDRDLYPRRAQCRRATGWMLFKDVVLPAALPSVLTGLRVSIGLAWILMVVGELVGAPSGLGATLMRAQDYAQTDRMLAYMLVIGFYGYLSDLLVVARIAPCAALAAGDRALT